jgi:ATP-dependent RNA helicase DOB1
MDAEFVIQRSFHSYQHAKAVPGMKVERDRVREEIAGIDEKLKNVSKESTEYGKLIERARRLEKELKRHELEPTRAMKFLTPGRLLKIRNGYDDFGWGCVVNAYQLSDEMLRMRGIDPSTKDIAPETVVVDCLMRVGPGASEGILTPADVNIDAGGTILEGEKKKRKRNTTEIVPVSLALVANIGELILELSDDLRDSTSRDAVYESVRTIVHTFKEKKGLRDVPSLDAVNALGCVEVSYASMVQELESVREKIKTHQLYEAGDDDEEMYYEKQKTLRAKMKDKNAPKEDFDEKAMFEKKATLEERSRVLSSRIKTSELSKFRDELSSRSKVLRKLNHVDAEGVVLPKGRCACEIDTADELLATELMFNGAFAKATPRELVALCSMFVPTEKSNQKPTIPKNLEVPIKGVLDAAKLIANTQLEQKLEIDVEKYVDSFRTFLVEIVHEWAGGKTFSEVLLRTDLFEGTIVRAMRRLDELMLELGRAAMACGDENLREKFEKGAELLRRGIVFAPSLYV